MSSLTVTWQNYDTVTTRPSAGNLSDLGGTGEAEANWPAYVAQYPTEWHPHLEAIRQSIIANQVWAGGDWHQEHAHGVLVLSDGHYMGCTYRDWGDLLAAVWSSKLGQQFSYMDFYMDVRLPDKPGKK